jgi:hypothetical protein
MSLEQVKAEHMRRRARTSRQLVHIGHCLLDAYMRRRALDRKELVALSAR